jgi:hypothetical protein
VLGHAEDRVHAEHQPADQQVEASAAATQAALEEHVSDHAARPAGGSPG